MYLVVVKNIVPLPRLSIGNDTSSLTGGLNIHICFFLRSQGRVLRLGAAGWATRVACFEQFRLLSGEQMLACWLQSPTELLSPSARVIDSLVALGWVVYPPLLLTPLKKERSFYYERHSSVHQSRVWEHQGFRQ